MGRYVLYGPRAAQLIGQTAAARKPKANIYRIRSIITAFIAYCAVLVSPRVLQVPQYRRLTVALSRYISLLAPKRPSATAPLPELSHTRSTTRLLSNISTRKLCPTRTASSSSSGGMCKSCLVPHLRLQRAHPAFLAGKSSAKLSLMTVLVTTTTTAALPSPSWRS